MNPYNPYQYNQFQYQQQYQPQINPYMQRQEPGFQQQNGLFGRIIDDISQITANDVPMDGSRAVFIKRDGSEIYTKQWCSDGSIRTSLYKPFSEPLANNAMNKSDEQDNGSGDLITAINERFDRLEKMFAPKQSSSKKKDGESE